MSQDLSATYKQFFKDTFSEFYEVVRTVEVIMDEECYRVEVVKACHESRVFYDARYWIERDVTLQPTYPQHDQNKLAPEDMRVFVKHTHVSVHHNDPDTALSEALSFLAQGKKKT